MSKFLPPETLPPETPPEGFTTNLIVTTKVPTKESRIGIRQADWDRLKRNLQKCKVPLPNTTRKADFMGALCITTFFTAASLALSKTPVESWIYTIFIVTTIFSALFAWEFNKVAHRDIEVRKSEVAEIEADMQEIESNIVQYQ